MISTLLKVCRYLRRDLAKSFANDETVRTTRARIIHLRNDYKMLMSKIELKLHEHHAAMETSNPSLAAIPMRTGSASVDETASHQSPVETPFAKVNSVVAGSPADEAGLKAGDKIRSFGNVNWMNHENLSKVAEVVQKKVKRL